MKAKKTTTWIILAIVLVVISGFIFWWRSVQKNNELPVYTSHGLYAFEISTPERAIGAYDYACIAKVNKKLRTEHTKPIVSEVSATETKVFYTPYTVYEIEVLENIKGSLITDRPIEFMQYGGLNEDGESYTLLNGGSLLKEGDYYILMSNARNDIPGETLISARPESMVHLIDGIEAESSQAVIEEYKAAYKNEIIPQELQGRERIPSKYDVNYKK
ncbi:MAG: hypothetical protein Q4F21_10930 [Lachnospiraceae bacterium]|nr:hypothetical protein [Lachnospiraceae bacterium]